jgi:hypothetical protein
MAAHHVTKILIVTIIMSLANFARAVEINHINQFSLSGVSLDQVGITDEPVFALRMPSSAFQDPAKEALSDRDYMAWVPLDFKDGTIDVDVMSNLTDDTPAYARGFVGISFRIDDQLRFESIYLRPTNSVADDQVRRNHSVQYAAYPDFRFGQLRCEFPEKYETYADIDTGRWIHMRLVVSGERAVRYLDHSNKPGFIVNDLKLGTAQLGGVGIWVESGTFAHFRNFKISHALDVPNAE